MRDGDFRVRGNHIARFGACRGAMAACAIAAIVVCAGACGGGKAPVSHAGGASAAGASAAGASAAGASAAAALGSLTPIAPGPACPGTGLWAACSILYRLDRAGLAPSIDSSGGPDEKMLTGAPLMLKIGFSARLEVHLYPDSAARIADEARIDRVQYVTPEQQQTMRRERTLIENANMVGLLTSINGHQRDRVADALMAGPPQPPTAQPIAPSRTKS